MKYYIQLLILSALSILVSCSNPPLPSTIKVMTYNIRYDNPKDGDNWWKHRKGEVVALIKEHNPDFIGLQEVMPGQLTFINQELYNYTYIGYPRDDVGSDSESAPIFYNPSKYEVVDRKTLWLSETPDRVSKGWDAALNRVVTYGIFRDIKSREITFVFNAHYDHIGTLARLKSSEFINNYIHEKNFSSDKIILLGDFNSLPTDAPIKTITSTFQDSYTTPGISVDGCQGTYNAFDTTTTATKRIDYIFTKNADVLSYKCIDDRRSNGLHISDHFALVVEAR